MPRFLDIVNEYKTLYNIFDLGGDSASMFDFIERTIGSLKINLPKPNEFTNDFQSIIVKFGAQYLCDLLYG
jgi:hypothetical protein